MNTVKLTAINSQGTQVYQIPLSNSQAQIINGQPNTAYVIQDPTTGRPIQVITTKRSGNNLLVSLDGNEQIDLAIQDYYAADNAKIELIGQASDGSYYSYQPINGNESGRIANLADGGFSTQTFVQDEVITPWWFGDGGFNVAYAIPALALGGGLAALAAGGGSDDDERKDSPAVVTGKLSSNINEDGNTASGNLTIKDADTADNPINFEASTLQGQYGQLKLISNDDGTASWEYVLDAQSAQPLDQGDTYTEIFTITAISATGKTTEREIKINVIGKNDAPVAVDEPEAAAIEFIWGDDDVSNQLINNLGGDKGYGENEVPRLDDDASSDPIDITSVFGEDGLNFYGTNYEYIYINANGNITFKDGLEDYTPNPIEGVTFPIIAPFWADVDQRGEPTNPEINHIWYDLDSDNQALTITWDQVGYFSENTDKLNTFQMQIKAVGESDFDVFFRYQDIQWTYGEASDGPPPVHARAGWSSGDGQFYEIPSSGDESYMLNLDKFSNSGNAGVFEFQVRDGVVYEGSDAYTATFDVLANDSDIDDSAVLTLVDATIVNGKGNVEITEDNQVIYTATPEALSAGDSQVTIEYTVKDEFGATDTATATVDLTSNFVNTAPLSQDFDVETSGTFIFSEADFPFIDPDLFNSFKSVVITELPTNGTLTLNGNAIAANTEVAIADLTNLVYAATDGVTDPSTFKFTVKDDGGTANNGNDTSEEYTATITLNTVNHAPIAVDSSVTLTEDNPYTFAVEDFGFADKQDGDDLTAIIISSAPSHGTLTLNGEVVNAGETISLADIASLLYTPGENISGPATLDFKVQDDGDIGGSNTNTISSETGTLTFEITSINDGAPTLIGIEENLQYTGNGSAQSIFANISATDTDIVNSAGDFDGLKIMVGRDVPNINDIFDSSMFTNSGGILYNGTDIGDFSNIDGQLTLSFDSGVGATEIDATLDRLTYSNTEAQAGDSYTFAWTVFDSDPAGVLSTEYTQNIFII